MRTEGFERNILGISACVALIGVLANVVMWSLGGEASLAYNGLLFTIGMSAIICYWLTDMLERGNALTAYAWIAGSSFGAMILMDCLKGEGWRHMFWMYEFGVVSLVFLAGSRRGKIFSIISGGLGLVACLMCHDSIISAGAIAVRPLAFWGVSAAIQRRFEIATQCMRVYLDAKEERRQGT